MPPVRRVDIALILTSLVIFATFTSCQSLQNQFAPTDLPTLPPPTGLALLETPTAPPDTAAAPTETATAEPSSPTPTVLSTAASTATPSPSATFSPAAVSTPLLTPAPGTATTLANSTPTATPCYGGVSGTAVLDLNGNRQVDAGEPGVPGAVLYIKNASGTLGWYTTGNGQFDFPGLPAGDYTLAVTPPTGYTAVDSAEAAVTVECGKAATRNFLLTSPGLTAPTAAPTRASAIVGGTNPPTGQVGGFSAFSTGPVRYISSCGTLGAPGLYMLQQSLVSQWDCLQITSDNVTLDCQGNSLNGVDGNGYGVVVHHTSPVLGRTVRNVEIRNCKMTAHRYGIFIDSAINLYVHDNVSSGNYRDVDSRGYGNFLGLAEGGGIRVNDTTGATLSNNRTDSSAIGIDVRMSSNIAVRNNSANGNTAWGVHFYGVTNSEISGNTSTNNVRYCTWGSGVVGPGCDAGGIMMQAGSSNNVVQNNIIAGQNGNGIFIKAHGTPCGDSNTIANNRIVGAMYNAIEMSFCRNNKVQGNEISNSLDGIWMGFAVSNEVDAGNYLHDMTNHGIISWNSQDNNVSSNRIVNSREGLYFYSSDYKKDEFYFVTGSPTDHISSGNCLCSNTVQGNSVAAFHLNNSVKNQVTGNTLIGNGINFKLEGNTSGNIIEDNSIQGGASALAPRAAPAAFRLSPSRALAVYDRAGRPLSGPAMFRALDPSPGDSVDVAWFKYKLRASLGYRPVPDAAAFLSFFEY